MVVGIHVWGKWNVMALTNRNLFFEKKKKKREKERPHRNQQGGGGSPLSVEILVSEFELKSRYYVHF